MQLNFYNKKCINTVNAIAIKMIVFKLYIKKIRK